MKTNLSIYSLRLLSFCGNGQLICTFLFSITFLFQLNAQTGVAPGMHWFKESWPSTNFVTGNPQNQNQSGEDWYYDIKPYVDGGEFEGYLLAGYNTFVNSPETSGACVNCSSVSYDPQDFEKPSYKDYCSKAKLAELDLIGNIIWYKNYGPTKGSSVFERAIQGSDNNYYAIGSVTYNGGIAYNPVVGDAGAILECDAAVLRNMYIVKTDHEGVLIKEATYGILDAAIDHMEKARTLGYDIIEGADGFIYVTGYCQKLKIDGVTPTPSRVFVMKLNKSLEVIWKQEYLASDLLLSSGTAILFQDGPTPTLFVGSYQEYDAGFGSFVHLLKINPSSGALINDYTIDNVVDPDIELGSSILENRTYCTIQNMTFDAMNQYILMPLLINREAPTGAPLVYAPTAAGEAEAKIYKYKLATNSISGIFDVTVGAERLKAADLKIDITLMTDGGYAIVSSKQAALLPNESNTLYNGTATIYDKQYWETDAFVARYNASDIKIWEKTYPVNSLPTTGYTPMFPAIDIKKKECLFAITEAEDGGIIIAGKSSHNLDDNVAIKLYNECDYNTSYSGVDIANGQIIATGSNIIWNVSRKVRGVIVVQKGAKLTITSGATIQFADSKAADYPTYILVERGGKLEVQGGSKLTGLTACGTMWDGIYVEGTNSAPHPSINEVLTGTYPTVSSNHGVVLINTGATIEHARVAVKAQSPVVANYPNYDGGIIICDGANFKNNVVDIYFASFGQSNISGARNCNFLTNAKLLDAIENPFAHVYLEQMKTGIQIRGNLFENSTPLVTYPEPMRGYGILSALSYFSCNDNPNNFNVPTGTGAPNIFNDLYYGVYVTSGYTGVGNVILKGNTFTNNNRSVYMGGTLALLCNLNTFNLDNNSTYGLYLDASTGYQVEENYFNGPATLTTALNGLIVNNSGTAANIIRRNNFNNLRFGIKAQGVNGNTGNGLVFKCNTFSTNKYDIAVTSGAIFTQQGACDAANPTKPAGNQFSDAGYVVLQGQFYLNGSVAPIVYHHHADLPPTNYTTSLITLDNCFIDFGITSCPQQVFIIGESGEEVRLANQIQFYHNRKHAVAFKTEDDAETEANDLDLIRNELVAYYLGLGMYDSVEYVLLEDTSAFANSVLYNLALSGHEFRYANYYIENLATQENANNEGFSSILPTIQLELAKDSLNWLEIDSIQLNQLETLISVDTREGIQANLLNELIQGVNYEEPIEDIIVGEDVRNIDKLVNESQSVIQVFPQPVSGVSNIYIKLNNSSPLAVFQIADLTGRVVVQKQLVTEENTFEFNAQGFSNGLYYGFITQNGIFETGTQIIVVK